MALTRITKGVIKPNENYDTHNINSTGIVTAIGLDINGNGDVSGNLSVGGVLTYEDVTSIDSVGIITAQKGIHVGAGVSAVGVGTFSGLDISGDIDVDGHTNLDNVSIAGITTGTIFKVPDATDVAGSTNHIAIGDNSDLKLFHDNNGNAQIFNSTGHLTIVNNTAGRIINLQPKSGANGIIARYEGAAELYHNGNLRLTTSSVGVSIPQDLDVDGHTNLDNVSIAGVTTGTTFVGDLTGEASQVTIGNGANNRIITASGTNTLDCSGNFTFGGNVMEIGAAGAEGGALYINGGTINNPGGRDAKVYIDDNTDNDWALHINKPSNNYGIQMAMSNSASHAFYISAGGAEKFRITGSGDIAKSGNIYPRTADTFDIGDNTTNRWRNIYSEKLFADDLIRLGTPPWNEASGDFRTLSISGRTANSSGFIYLGNGVATTNADFDLGRIRIHNGATEVALITGTTDTSANDDGRIEFHTRNSGGSLQERLRIKSDGTITINSTGSQPSSTVSGYQFDAGGATVRIASGAGASGTTSSSINLMGSNHNANIANGANSGAQLNLYNYNTNDGNSSAVSFLNSNSLSVARILGQNVSHSSRTGDIIFMVSNGSYPVQQMRLRRDGKLQIGNGTVTTSGTLNVKGNAVLDDGTNARITLQADGTSTNQILSTTTNFGSYCNMKYQAADHIFQYGGNELVRIKADGKVGINIDNNTTADLQVRTGTNGAGYFRLGGGSGNGIGMDMDYTNSGTTKTTFKQNYRSTNPDALMEFDSGYFNFKTGTSGESRLKISKHGQLLLGNSSEDQGWAVFWNAPGSGADAGTAGADGGGDQGVNIRSDMGPTHLDLTGVDNFTLKLTNQAYNGAGIANPQGTISKILFNTVTYNGWNSYGAICLDSQGVSAARGEMVFMLNDSSSSMNEKLRIKSNQMNTANGLGMNIYGENVNHSDDAVLLVDKTGNADWCIQARSTGNDYGMYARLGSGAAYALAVYATDTSSFRFRVRGDGVIFASNTTIQSISDVRLKENIVDANSQWDDIKGLRFRNFNWKSDSGYDDGKTMLGLIAQEVEPISPNLVDLDAQTKEDIENGVPDPEYKSVKYSIVWMKAVKALQEAQVRIEQLEAKVASLEGS